jgi:cyanate permease
MKDWKSTVSSILTGLIGTFSTIAAFQVPAAMLNPQQTRVWLYVVVVCNLAAIIGKVWVGILTNNADAAAVAKAMNAPPDAPAPTSASLSATPK